MVWEEKNFEVVKLHLSEDRDNQSLRGYFIHKLPPLPPPSGSWALIMKNLFDENADYLGPFYEKQNGLENS